MKLGSRNEFGSGVLLCRSQRLLRTFLPSLEIVLSLACGPSAPASHTVCGPLAPYLPR